MVGLDLNHIYEGYPDASHYTVGDFDLDIKDRGFVVFAGPSGCDRSTTLRMAAGFEGITEGGLKINSRVANDKTPEDHNTAMVFQSYALYLHMTVYDNMVFGLKPRKHEEDDIDKRVRGAAGILGLAEFPRRKPAGLSGS